VVEFNLPRGTELKVDGVLNEERGTELHSAGLFLKLLGRPLLEPCRCRLCVN
jgi:hypothetical protein